MKNRPASIVAMLGGHVGGGGGADALADTEGAVAVALGIPAPLLRSWST